MCNTYVRVVKCSKLLTANEACGNEAGMKCESKFRLCFHAMNVCKIQTNPRLAWWRTTMDLPSMCQLLWCSSMCISHRSKIVASGGARKVLRLPWMYLIYIDLSVNVVVQVGITYVNYHLHSTEW